MGVSISIASGKDGSGKSIVTVNLGLALSNMGVSTMIVDGDIRGPTVGLLLGVVEPEVPTIHHVLSNAASPESAIIECYGVKAVVGALRINQLLGISLEKLPSILERYADVFDVLLVDSPAGLGEDVFTVVGSCKRLVLVLTPELNSIIHAIKTLVLAKRVGTEVMGVIINRAGGAYDIPADQISDFLRLDTLGVIPEDEMVKKAVSEGVPVFKGHPNSSFSREIKKIAALLAELL